jgi:hypothetical protein
MAYVLFYLACDFFVFARAFSTLSTLADGFGAMLDSVLLIADDFSCTLILEYVEYAIRARMPHARVINIHFI